MYEKRNAGHNNLVQFNDVAFGLHALICSIIIWCQVRAYRPKKSENSPLRVDDEDKFTYLIHNFITFSWVGMSGFYLST